MDIDGVYRKRQFRFFYSESLLVQIRGWYVIFRDVRARQWRELKVVER